MPSSTLPSARGPTINNSKPAIDHSGPTKRPPTTGNIKVGVWNLRSTEFTELEAPENTESLFSGSVGESVIGEDNRKKVNKKDFMPGGKYRCKPSFAKRCGRKAL